MTAAEGRGLESHSGDISPNQKPKSPDYLPQGEQSPEPVEVGGERESL